MTPSQLSRRIVADRLDWAGRMLKSIRALPLNDRQLFFSDQRNVWTAESCLRRALEALLDLGRHILSKGFGEGPTEYKEIATLLEKADVLKVDEATLLRTLAGYRNRLVHFYHEVSDEELYNICAHQLSDIDRIIEAYQSWIQAHPDLIDNSL